MCGAMQSSAMHKLVRRGLLLRDELGRPQWAAISNNLPSLGSVPERLSEIQRNTQQRNTLFESALYRMVGLSVGHLCRATWRAAWGGGGGADITHNELEEVRK